MRKKYGDENGERYMVIKMREIERAGVWMERCGDGQKCRRGRRELYENQISWS